MILQQAAKPLTLPPKEKPRRKQVEEFFHKAESNSIAWCPWGSAERAAKGVLVLPLTQKNLCILH